MVEQDIAKVGDFDDGQLADAAAGAGSVSRTFSGSIVM